MATPYTNRISTVKIPVLVVSRLLNKEIITQYREFIFMQQLKEASRILQKLKSINHVRPTSLSMYPKDFSFSQEIQSKSCTEIVC